MFLNKCGFCQVRLEASLNFGAKCSSDWRAMLVARESSSLFLMLPRELRRSALLASVRKLAFLLELPSPPVYSFSQNFVSLVVEGELASMSCLVLCVYLCPLKTNP